MEDKQYNFFIDFGEDMLVCIYSYQIICKTFLFPVPGGNKILNCIQS